jgi:hypothetical protein
MANTESCEWTMNYYEKVLAKKLSGFYQKRENYDAFVHIKGKCSTAGKNIALSTLFDNLAILRQSNIVLDGLYTDFYSQFEKDYFDIFARGARVYIHSTTREIFPSNGNDMHENKEHIQTTLCQLNFMFFLISNNLLRELIVLQHNLEEMLLPKQELLMVFQPTFLKI